MCCTSKDVSTGNVEDCVAILHVSATQLGMIEACVAVGIFTWHHQTSYLDGYSMSATISHAYEHIVTHGMG
jgi:hypothetical protein